MFMPVTREVVLQEGAIHPAALVVAVRLIKHANQMLRAENPRRSLGTDTLNCLLSWRVKEVLSSGMKTHYKEHAFLLGSRASVRELWKPHR